MRLGVDLLALQSEGSRGRGVGRYSADLLQALSTARPDAEFVLYGYRDLPEDRIPRLDGHRTRWVEIGRDETDDTIRGRWAEIALRNPDDLDLLLILNPLELAPGYEPPPRAPGGLAIAAVLYDLIPLLFPESYLSDPGVRRRYERRLETIRHYDRFLAISESTARDATGRLGLRESRVTPLPFVVDPRFRPANPTGEDDDGDERALDRLGIARPFVLHVGGRDDRKNVWGVLDAFAGLPPALRAETQLVLVGDYDPAYRERISAYRADAEVNGRVVVPGVVDDENLESLYRRCAAFVFPSRYEGLGLPLLEAMSSGAAVIAARNSAQVDVVGSAGILVDADDAMAMASHLGRLLSNRGLAEEFGRKARARTAGLDREGLGRAAGAALQETIPSKMPRPHLRLAPARPRIGLVSPMPPKQTGIADYAARLAEALADRYTIDLYHDGDYIPEPALRDRRFRCVDRAAFPRRSEVLPYRAFLYQMGNSWYHRSVYELMRLQPGITVLHDFNLAGFHHWYAHQPDVAPGHFDQVVARERAAGTIGPEEDVESWRAEPGSLQGAAVRRNVHFNREIFERSRLVVVHSPYCRELVRATLPEFLDRTVVVPMGASLNQPSAGRKAETRAKYGIPGEALVFGCVGNLTSMKMYEEAIRAFSISGRQVDRAVLLFVGKDWEDGRAKELVRAEGLADRTIFVGEVLRDDYEHLVGIVDVGICLRRPPTYGETSASLLDFLRSGVATIVTDVASFRDYPDEVVVKWNPDQDGPDGLADRMLKLGRDEQTRRMIGKAALDHVRRCHDWSIAAEAYADLIDRCAADRPSTRDLAHHALNIPGGLPR